MSREDHDRLSTADLAGTDPRLADRPPAGTQQQARQEAGPAMQDQQPQPAAMREAQMREAQMREAQMREGQMQDPQRRADAGETQAREAQARDAQMRGQPSPDARPATPGGHEMEQL